MRYTPLLLLCIALLSCDDTPSRPTINGNGTTFTIFINTDQYIDGLDRFGFQRVDSDGRCPTDAVCVWEGIAHTRFWLKKPSSDTAFIPLSIYGYITEKDSTHLLPRDTLGYRFTLRQLDPYPLTKVKPDPNAYVAKVFIKKL